MDIQRVAFVCMIWHRLSQRPLNTSFRSLKRICKGKSIFSKSVRGI